MWELYLNNLTAASFTPTYLGSTSILVWRMELILRWRRCCTSFSAPVQWLLIQNYQISVAWNYIIAQFDRVCCLIVSQVFIGGSKQIIVPDTTANGVKYNALKAVIITHWPMLVWRSCKMWHYLFCKNDISRNQIDRANVVPPSVSLNLAKLVTQTNNIKLLQYWLRWLIIRMAVNTATSRPRI